MRLYEALEKKLNKKELELVPRAFDMVGSIAIFNEFPKELKKKEKLIAETLMQLNPYIKTVAKKTGKYTGKYRTPKIAIITGEKTKETLHKENSISLRLNVETCYFSTRTATERLRVAKQVKKGDKVLVMFSGVGPFPCVIAKNAQPSLVYGIEVNKEAHTFALENIKINKLENVVVQQGDVKKIMPKIKETFNKILLPLPKKAEDYLDLALAKLKPKGKIYLYMFVSEYDFGAVKKAYQRRFKKVNLVECGRYSPGVSRICLELTV
ncbi:hypothetical protein J4208_04500 [Candidatus Woesearchaeota archaeon]|nr:hypothetical protein [Candidatus Woesearchaeota archaeon]